MAGGARVALVLVSHAREAADGVARIAGQMAPDVVLAPAGGTDDGGLGTSVDLVTAAVARAAADASGVVVLTDLGSAVMTAETVLEMLDDDVRERVVLADAPFLEGAVGGAVAAQQGGDLAAVVAAAEQAGRRFAAAAAGRGATSGAAVPGADAAAGQTVDAGDAGDDGDVVTERVVLPNPLGLHARPAALLARAVADLGVPVTVDGADGASVLELMALGAVGGHELTVSASGPRAREAVDAVVALVEEGFGET